MKNLYFLDWTEYESGWGCRPDGLQMFADYSELEKVLERDKKTRSEAKSTPYEYSIPTTKHIAMVDEKDFEEATKMIGTGTGVWFSEAGKRDMTHVSKVFKSLKLLSSNSL